MDDVKVVHWFCLMRNADWPAWFAWRLETEWRCRRGTMAGTAGTVSPFEGRKRHWFEEIDRSNGDSRSEQERVEPKILTVCPGN
ncbi:hypothetical protein B0T26DRAFT_710815 [Lasiosphaeria miniovina]|uniref:Uncharacterized protein n=1 Tax=Lasiosphaeria miniovina TaxID=1954250 RepID=A0AA40AKZ8_9PEZI|nr:uncharacterized protein B0T26DRAFT_710815 [Lasiosphaeria miniovina]KAK0717764.1 hypothetical protein B0T26DRAFT_710815 [Lasiosphaeria miniovina]